MNSRMKTRPAVLIWKMIPWTMMISQVMMITLHCYRCHRKDHHSLLNQRPHPLWLSLRKMSFKPTKRSRLQRHVDVHLKNAVSFKDKKICKCNLDCRTDGHYHCPQCERTIIRRDAMTSHLLLCQGASAPVSSAVLPTPAVNQRIQITTHIQLPHSPAYRTLTTMCDHCGFVLLRKNLKQHLLRKHPEIATPLEGAQSDPVSVAQQHGTMKHAEGTRRRRRLTATCTICGRPVTMKNMRAHMNRKHPDSW
uniref:uncharacterized protein LOC124017889 isoform X3 n=1 Tax=Oncorhynchus gorbuscha TaxID=8017 RepID=UPI001EAEFDA6|nr:uncharacterized protein LOC124017889 isoform X3 [Oncorhynchus gorbuscha]